MRRIQLIGTGGTIACLPSNNGLTPKLTANNLLDFLDIDISNIECVDVFNMDSSNIQPEEWCSLASAINRAATDFDAIVVTHGTDTMAYTASMLSFMLQGIQIPVIFTGAQYPIVNPGSDGKKNLEDAIIAARSMHGGVFVCFGGFIIQGSRACKTHTTSLNAFESINYPYVGVVIDKKYVNLHTPKGKRTYNFAGRIDPRVALIKLVPGTSPAILDSMLLCDIKGIVVEAFGLGGVHNVRRDHTESLIQLMEHGITVILASQCLYETASPDIYAVSRSLKDAGILPAYALTSEAAVTKLMWVLGQTDDPEMIKKLMKKNLSEEIHDVK